MHSKNKTWFSFVELEEKATKWRELSRVASSCMTNVFRRLAPLVVGHWRRLVGSIISNLLWVIGICCE